MQALLTDMAEPINDARAAARPTQATYAELQHAYDHLNRALFEGKLPDCLLTLQREKHSMGYFSAARFVGLDGRRVDEIALNPSYFAVMPLVETLQTIAHEMVHLWQHHFGKPSRARYHNDEWANKMERIGLMPTSTGRPGGRRTGDKVSDYAIEGGAFLEAARALVTEEFKLSWMDRFPSSKQMLAASCAPSVDLPVEVGGGPAPMHEMVRASVEAQQKAGDLNAHHVVVCAPREASRARYVCECGILLWGKPGLKVMCCACSTVFQVG